MTRNEITIRFPNASESFIKENIRDQLFAGNRYENQLFAGRPEQASFPAYNPRPPAKLEPDSSNASLGAPKIQRAVDERILVRFTSKRKRLIDEDNQCCKYICDLLRYSGIIQDDSPDKTKIEVSQIKCKKGEEEEIIIEVFEND